MLRVSLVRTGEYFSEKLMISKRGGRGVKYSAGLKG